VEDGLLGVAILSTENQRAGKLNIYKTVKTFSEIKISKMKM
jgi:hypothetical protein